MGRGVGEAVVEGAVVVGSLECVGGNFVAGSPSAPELHPTNTAASRTPTPDTTKPRIPATIPAR
ncbi:MAG TPA: hypothetical protein VHX59_16770 [Mycobacteriales bacterium]|nr:hypothetical protein [Mycobacteriales bacterium]